MRDVLGCAYPAERHVSGNGAQCLGIVVPSCLHGRHDGSRQDRIGADAVAGELDRQ